MYIVPRAAVEAAQRRAHERRAAESSPPPSPSSPPPPAPDSQLFRAAAGAPLPASTRRMRAATGNTVGTAAVRAMRTQSGADGGGSNGGKGHSLAEGLVDAWHTGSLAPPPFRAGASKEAVAPASGFAGFLQRLQGAGAGPVFIRRPG